MSTFTINRCFEVPAPAERVWSYLTTPECVVTCLPGAALVSSSEDGRTHEGTVTVKLGAISVAYGGIAEFEELDSAAYKLRVVARGREQRGAGSAEMRMQAEVADQGPAESQVALEASVNVTGRIVSFGRGMIEIVAEQVLTDFASSLCERLRATYGEAGSGDVAAAGFGPSAEAASVFGHLWRAIKSWLRRLLGRG